MSAAQRAAALLEAREIDCPRCGAFPMAQGPAFDLGAFGGRVEGNMICGACGLECSRTMCCVAGQPGDETAALHILPEEDKDG